MWLAWWLTPKKKLVAAIIDKTALTSVGQDHLSLTWILKHEKFTKTKTKLYDPSHDYFGFLPQQSDQYRIKGLERFTPLQLEQLSKDCDMAYYTDTYGIYLNEWYSKKNAAERSGIIYGGLSQHDVDFLRKMKEKKKLIITEFNTIGSPTSEEIRGQFESMFALKWSGWSARFYSSLDTNDNRQIPKWLLKIYINKHNGRWPFKAAGIAFINNNEDLVILEEGTDVNNPMPYIQSTDAGKKLLNIPDDIKYPFWFDVMLTDSSVNKMMAHFDLDLTPKGEAQLEAHNIPLVIPAVLMHKQSDYEFYYFSGDFCDNPISISTAYFRGISMFQKFFYNKNDMLERTSFFWKFYKPMVTSILSNYYRTKDKRK
jgi:hypothetical protein